MVNPVLALALALMFGVLLVLVFWPESGLYSRWKTGRRVTERVLVEDILKHAHKYEIKRRPATLGSAAGAAQLSLDLTGELISKMEGRGLLRFQGGVLRLTSQGRELALHIIRTHRLWERYLAESTGYAESEWHRRAEEQEHRLSPQETQALSARLGNPTHDPHGDPIPTAEGHIYQHGGRPLSEMPIDRPFKIVHLEDEPPTVYAQLVAEGLHPGMRVRIAESSPQRIRFWADGEEVVLAPLVAANVSVVAAPEETDKAQETMERLSDLALGEEALVNSVSPGCRGLERRRFMDLGILPGTAISVEMVSPSGDPTAYRVRGSVVALRREQARHINVTRTGGTTS